MIGRACRQDWRLECQAGGVNFACKWIETHAGHVAIVPAAGCVIYITRSRVAKHPDFRPIQGSVVRVPAFKSQAGAGGKSGRNIHAGIIPVLTSTGQHQLPAAVACSPNQGRIRSAHGVGAVIKTPPMNKERLIHHSRQDGRSTGHRAADGVRGHERVGADVGRLEGWQSEAGPIGTSNRNSVFQPLQRERGLAADAGGE